MAENTLSQSNPDWHPALENLRLPDASLPPSILGLVVRLQLPRRTDYAQQSASPRDKIGETVPEHAAWWRFQIDVAYRRQGLVLHDRGRHVADSVGQLEDANVILFPFPQVTGIDKLFGEMLDRQLCAVAKTTEEINRLIAAPEEYLRNAPQWRDLTQEELVRYAKVLQHHGQVFIASARELPQGTEIPLQQLGEYVEYTGRTLEAASRFADDLRQLAGNSVEQALEEVKQRGGRYLQEAVTLVATTQERYEELLRRGNEIAAVTRALRSGQVTDLVRHHTGQELFGKINAAKQVAERFLSGRTSDLESILRGPIWNELARQTGMPPEFQAAAGIAMKLFQSASPIALAGGFAALAGSAGGASPDPQILEQLGAIREMLAGIRSQLKAIQATLDRLVTITRENQRELLSKLSRLSERLEVLGRVGIEILKGELDLAARLEEYFDSVFRNKVVSPETYERFTGVFKFRSDYFVRTETKLAALVAGGQLSQLFILEANSSGQGDQSSDVRQFLDEHIFPYYELSRRLPAKAIVQFAQPLSKAGGRPETVSPSVHIEALQSYRLFLNPQMVQKFAQYVRITHHYWHLVDTESEKLQLLSIEQLLNGETYTLKRRRLLEQLTKPLLRDCLRLVNTAIAQQALLCGDRLTEVVIASIRRRPMDAAEVAAQRLFLRAQQWADSYERENLFERVHPVAAEALQRLNEPARRLLFRAIQPFTLHPMGTKTPRLDINGPEEEAYKEEARLLLATTVFEESIAAALDGANPVFSHNLALQLCSKPCSEFTSESYSLQWRNGGNVLKQALKVHGTIEDWNRNGASDRVLVLRREIKTPDNQKVLRPALTVVLPRPGELEQAHFVYQPELEGLIQCRAELVDLFAAYSVDLGTPVVTAPRSDPSALPRILAYQAATGAPLFE
jgi:hypothetical protein